MSIIPSISFSIFKYTVQVAVLSKCLIFTLDVTSLRTPSGQTTDSQKRFIESNGTYMLY